MDRHINFLLVRSPVTYNDIWDSEPIKYIRYSAAIKVPICLDMARGWRSNFRTVDGNNNRLCRLKKCMPSKHINANNDNYYIYISNSPWRVWNSKLHFVLYLGVLRRYCGNSLHANARVWVWKFCWSLWGIYISLRNSCLCISNYTSWYCWFQNWRQCNCWSKECYKIKINCIHSLYRCLWIYKSVNMLFIFRF